MKGKNKAEIKTLLEACTEHEMTKIFLLRFLLK